jgi:putative transposase
VWLYFGFALSYRNIEEMMAQRGVPVTYETVREWCQNFGSLLCGAAEKEERNASDQNGTWTKPSSR